VSRCSASTPPAQGDLAPPVPAGALAGSVPATWTGDPAVWVQIEETLALLPAQTAYQAIRLSRLPARALPERRSA